MGSLSLPKNNEIVSATAYEKPPPPPPEGGGGKIWLNSYKIINPALLPENCFYLALRR